MKKTGENSSFEVKKVLILANSTWNLYNFRMPLIKKLQTFCEVLAAAPTDSYEPALRQKNVHFYPLPPLIKGLFPLKVFFYLYAIYRICAQTRPTTLLTFTYFPNILGALIGKFLGIPVVPTICGLGFLITEKGWKPMLGFWLYKISLRKTPAVIFHNADDQTLFLEKGVVSEHQCQIVPGSGIDLQKHACQLLPERVPITFLMAARLLYHKGIFEFVEAAQKVHALFPEINFILAGIPEKINPDRIEESRMQYLMRNPHVQFMESVRNMKALINRSHCIVLPSHREGLSRFLLEGMAMGRPVITTYSPGCQQLVHHLKNGFLIQPANSDALAEAIITFYNSPSATWQQMGTYSRKLVVQHYTVNHIAKAYTRLIDGLST